jgi:ribosome biogenesis protein Tsr3
VVSMLSRLSWASNFASVISISGARSSVISMSSRLSWGKSFCLSDLYIYISGARSSVISMSSRLSWAKSFCLSDLYIWSKKFSHFHVVAAVVSKVILPQSSLYISGARSSVISMSSQLSWAKSFCLSDLYIYLEQEVQSFGLWEKWSQYGGIGVQ